MTDQFELNDALTALGMKQAFQKTPRTFPA